MRNFLLLLFLLLLCQSCNPYARLLRSEHSMLTRVASSGIPAEQKLDSLFASSIRVMEAALKPVNPVKGGKIVAQYYEQNEAAMERIAREATGNFERLSLLDRGAFILKVGTSGNARKFAALYPKFKAKYKEVRGAAKMLGFFARMLGKLGKLAELLG